MKAKYFALFKYSPSNTNPSVYKKGDDLYLPYLNGVKSDIDTVKKYKAKKDRTAFEEEWMKYLETKIYLALIKEENNVMCILDEEYNILHETKNVWHHGEYTQEVYDLLDKYNLTFSDNYKYASTLEMLIESINNENIINKMFDDDPNLEENLLKLFTNKKD